MFRHTLTASTALLALTVPALPAIAQVETVVITAPRAVTLTVPTIDEARNALEETPGGVGIVAAEDYRDGSGVTIRDMLGFEPGVFAQPKFGEDSRLSIRGSGLSRNFHLRGVRLLQDGVTLNHTDGSGDFQEVDPLAFSYVEVFKGANALRYGAANLGGAINFVTPTGRMNEGVGVLAEGGSHDFFRVSGSAGGEWENYDAYAHLSRSSATGFRDHNDGNALRFNGNLGWRFADDAESRFYLTTNAIDQNIPGALSRLAVLSNPRSANPTNVAQHYARDIDSVRVQNKTSFVFDGTLIDLGANYSYRHLWHPIFQVLENYHDDYGVTARAEGQLELGTMPFSWTIGTNLMRGRVDAKRYVNIAGEAGAPTAEQDEYARQYEVYGSGRLTIADGLSLIAGGQWAYSERRMDDHFLSNGDQSGEREFREFSPRFGAMWEAMNGIQVFANASASFEPPPLSELASSTTIFTELDGQSSWTYELGTRGTSGDMTWGFSLYRANLEKEFQFFEVSPGVFSVVNADQTVHQGIEASLSWIAGRNVLTENDEVSLRGAYTFNDFFFDDDAAWGNNLIPGAPRHYFTGEIRYAHPSGVWLAPNIEWVPEAYYADNANTLATEAYAIFGAKAGWDISERISLFVDARNLGDKAYISNVSVIAAPTPSNQTIFNPGDGRSVFVGLEFRT
jgi:iron complex outermembrane receptor protein